MDSILKVIYNDRYTVCGEEEYLLNGVHPAVIEHIKTNYDRTNVTRDVVINNIQKFNTSDTWCSFFRAGNFIGYYVKHFPRENIIKIEDIKDDNSIYLFPVDVGGTLEHIYIQHKLHLDGKNYSYHFIDTIDPVILDHIKTGKVKIVFNCIHDPVYSSKTLRQVEIYLNNIGIDSRNIFVIFGNNYKIYFKEFPDSKLNITSGFLPLGQAGERIDTYPNVTSLGYISDVVRETDLNANQLRTKKFLCFNRNLKLHRYFLAYLALKLNLLNDSYFSFLVHSGGGINDINHTLDYYSVDNTYAQRIVDIVPCHLDTHDLPNNQLNGFATNNNKKQLYLNSYIHITSETIFDEGDPKNPFFSEKTFHPITNLQPFIYVGNPYSLRTLKSLGFKTFHPFIDESYDEEEDPKVRMSLITKEIERFNSMSIEEIHNWYYSLTDILLHNQQHCNSYKKYNPFESTIKTIKNIHWLNSSMGKLY